MRTETCAMVVDIYTWVMELITGSYVSETGENLPA
jgi:hypothetical protein